MKPKLAFASLIVLALSAPLAAAQGTIDLDQMSKQKYDNVDGMLMTESQKREYEAKKAQEQKQAEEYARQLKARRDAGEDAIAMGDRGRSLMLGNPTVPPPR